MPFRMLFQEVILSEAVGKEGGIVSPLPTSSTVDYVVKKSLNQLRNPCTVIQNKLL